MSAKDPAFLFYSSDFLTGTMFLTDEQVGKFIRLLCLQHQKGHLRKKDMLKICKTYDEDVFDMFKTDELDMYYNERLETESNKRKAYSESRRKNRKKKDESSINISKTYVQHMENENENENINKNRNKVNIPTEQEFLEYGTTIYKQLGKDSEPYKFALLSKYNSWIDNGWKNGHGKPIKNWKNNLNNTIPHIKGIYNGKQSNKNGLSYSTEFQEELARKIQS
tara:strand:- start:221 stop:889 length:669 start_codon:yes stop_codon:yes gene_type:complete